MNAGARSRAVEEAVLVRVRNELPLLGDARVLGVRCKRGFRWKGETSTVVEGRPVRIEVCPSVLGVLAALVGADRPAGADGGAGPPDSREVVVVLTPVEDSELGPDVLARLHRHQLLEASRQTLLHDLAGGRALDAGIVATGWLSDALVDHFADAGADRRNRAVPLTRQDAVELLLTARLGLDPATLDATTALDQVLRARHASPWATVDPVLRDHLVDEARDRWGQLVGTVLRMAARSVDLLPGLLLLDVVGHSHGDLTAAAAGGVVVNELVGSTQLPEGLQRDLAARAVDLVRRRRTDPDVVSALDIAHTRAKNLRIDALLGASEVLPAGLDRRFDAAAHDLTDAMLGWLTAHLDAGQPYQRARIERVRCALRLRRWLAGPVEPVTTVGSALQHYLDDGGWVDRALEEIGIGDSRSSVQQLLDEVRRAVVQRRDATDRQAAERLAAAASGALGSVVPVERVLGDVVGPLVATSGTRALLVVLDGMSAATAVGLAAELTAPGGQWREVIRAGGGGKRLPVLATLPSETTYSRTSLLSGSLRQGTAADERAAFRVHPVWSGRTAELFHRAELGGTAGADVGPAVAAALDPAESEVAVVGVVLNTVDDALTKGVQHSSAHLGVDDIDWLRGLLARAWYSGRTVVFVSDHGHVLDRGDLTELRSVAGGGARWRPAGSGPVTENEVTVTGPRVLSANHSGIFAATPGIRYAKRTHGYHGGAALAEITVPLLAFVPVGRPAPAGWSLAGRLTPGWWTGETSTPVPGSFGVSAVETSAAVGHSARTITEPDLFEAAGRSAPVSIPAPAPAPAPGRGASLVRSTAYAATVGRVPAPVRLEAAGVARLLDAALAAGGTIGYAEAIGHLGAMGRAERGVFQMLRRLLNVDGYEVVTIAEVERTLTINRQLLDDQFPVRP